jgi:hypothetical protein
VPEAVDPSPLIAEKLKALAAEYEPQIEALERAVIDAGRSVRRSLKKDLRATKHAYRSARRESQKLRGPSVAW